MRKKNGRNVNAENLRTQQYTSHALQLLLRLYLGFAK